MAGRKQAGDSWRDESSRLAQLLKGRRADRNQSQEQVARDAQLATSTLRKIESNAIREPGVFTVIALLRALELPLDALESVLSTASTEDDESDGSVAT